MAFIASELGIIAGFFFFLFFLISQVIIFCSFGYFKICRPTQSVYELDKIALDFFPLAFSISA